MAKRANTVRKSNWEIIFSNINMMGMQSFGEETWLTMVGTAQRHVSDSGLILNTTRERALVSIGLFLGASYQKAIAGMDAAQTPCACENSEDCQCQSTETASQTSPES